MKRVIFTIGHSQHSTDFFLSLLRRHRITAIADVRSQPYSRLYPQFSREPLQKLLRGERISYVFLGEELGGRTDDPSCHTNGQIDYNLVAHTLEFNRGIQRLVEGATKFRIAILCSEKEPLNCHRCILVGRRLRERDIPVHHILANGDVEDHEDSVERLLMNLKMAQPHMFFDRRTTVDMAYEIQAKKIAFSIEQEEDEQSAAL